MSKARGGEHPLTVAVRVRPITESELLAGGTLVAHPVDKQMVVLLDPSEDPDDILRANRSRERRYMFDHAFDETADQEEVYQVTTRFLIDQVINGYNGTVFAYGATGAGKTYTMLGTQDNPGIYWRALNDLFKLVEKGREEHVMEVSMSYLEIYNEMIRDLLNTASGYLEMREDAKGGVQVAGLSEVSTKATVEIMELLHRGNMERTQEPTKANKTSSRSHAVLQITVKQRNRARGINSQVKVGRLFLVDLAGSERAANTQNRGKRMVEGAHINRSLLALGNCITALSESNDKGARTYVNYRDSKLTRLLKDALGGNCKTVMIAHLGPASFHFEESRNTLLYADRAKRIKNKVRRNVEDVSYHIAQYSQIISELRGEIERLRAKVSQSITQPGGIQAVQNEVLRNANDQEFFKLKEQLMMTFKDQMELRRSLMDLKNTSLDISIETNRHALTLSDWEVDLTKRKENGVYDKETEKQLDLAGLGYDDEEPQEISMARDELKVLLAEKKKIEKLKTNVSKEFDIARQKAAMLEENLPRFVSTESQKEILTLLLRIHELEIENVEYQSRLYLRENELSQRDFIISRYISNKSLAEAIMSAQRDLLQDHAIVAPKELEELYEMYQHEQQQLEDSSNRNFLPSIKTGSQMNLVEMGGSTINLDRLSTLAEEPPNRYSRTGMGATGGPSSHHLQHPATPRLVISRPISPDDGNKVFSLSPKSLGVRDSHNRHLVVSPLKVKQKEDTLYTISMRSNSVDSLEKKDSSITMSPRGTGSHQAINGGAGDRPREITQETRGIAALAAAKKRRQQQQDSMRLAAVDAGFNRTFISTQADDETVLTPSRLANHNLKYALGSRYNLHDEQMVDDSESYGETRSLMTERHADHRDGHGTRGKVPRPKYRPSNRIGGAQQSTPAKNISRTKKTSYSRQTQPKPATWKPVERPPAKPRTNKITSKYLKNFGSVNNNDQSSTPHSLQLQNQKYNGTRQSRSNGKDAPTTRGGKKPTIPSYSKGDITVAGFGLRY